MQSKKVDLMTRERQESRLENEDVSLNISSSSHDSFHSGCNIIDYYDDDFIESCTPRFDSFDSLRMSIKNAVEETYLILSGFDNIGTSNTTTSKIGNGRPKFTDENMIMERMKFVSFRRHDRGISKNVDNDIKLKDSSSSLHASFDGIAVKIVNSPKSILHMKKPMRTTRSVSSTSVHSLFNDQKHTQKNTVTKGISKKLSRISSIKQGNALIMEDSMYRNGKLIYIIQRN